MKKTVLILFILIPALILSLIFALPDRELSEKENRSLMTKSNISGDIRGGGFQSDFESYLSDQFPFKDGLVFAQTKLRLLSGQRDIGGAYICKNSRLIQKITSADINEKSLLSYAEKIGALSEKSKVYYMPVPSAEIELESELPKGAPVYDYAGLLSKLESCSKNAEIIDLRHDLSSAESYYKTDHHWTLKGAYKAYAAFCRAKGETAKPLEEFAAERVSEDFQGTLYSKVPAVKTRDEIFLPEVCELKVTADGKAIDFYDLSALETKDKYNVFQGGNHGIVEIENENAKNNKTLLILKDSFANSFVPFIVQDYSKIILLDERYVFISVSDYANQIKPDEILVLKEIIN